MFLSVCLCFVMQWVEWKGSAQLGQFILGGANNWRKDHMKSGILGLSISFALFEQKGSFVCNMC